MERILIGDASSVVVGRGVASADGLLPERDGRRRTAILAQPSVARLARSLARGLRSGGVAADVRVLPDREEAKTLAAVGDTYEWLNELGLTRDDTIVGVGGGALTDVAGFAAATYLRGVEAVLVPTTLLGAVDASIGGKTGINVGGKNLVGVFRHPARVVVDVDLLDRLPEDLLREGAAEVLKAGLIGDPVIVDRYERDGLGADLEELVRRAVAVKAGIVERDFRESGERAHLNYGHTVGHAVEVAAGLPHGHAVAIGMIAAGRASALAVGFPDEARQRAVIEALGLPVAAPGVGRGAVTSLVGLDKKRDAAGVRFVLLERVGTPTVRHVDPATLDAALTAVGIEED